MGYLDWIEAHPGLSGWVQGIGTLFAALIAVYAAKVAYSGAIAQATATRDVYRQEVRDRQRAVAAALWAELNDCRLRITGMVHALRSTKVRRPSMLPLIDITIEIYEANREAIGLLPPLEAWQVVQCYKALGHIQNQISNLRGSKSEGMNDDFAASFAEQVSAPLGPLDRVLAALALTAEFPPDTNSIVDKIAKSGRSRTGEGAS